MSYLNYFMVTNSCSKKFKYHIEQTIPENLDNKQNLLTCIHPCRNKNIQQVFSFQEADFVVRETKLITYTETNDKVQT